MSKIDYHGPMSSFAPLDTGDGLPAHLMEAWTDFCGALLAADRAFYNTWIENRHGRDRDWRLWQVRAVPASIPGGKEKPSIPAIALRCPTPLWRRYLEDGLGHHRKLCRVPLIVTGWRDRVSAQSYATAAE